MFNLGLLWERYVACSEAYCGLWTVVIAAKLSKLPRIINTAPVRRCGLSIEIKTSKCSNGCPSVSSATAAETFFLMGLLGIEGASKMFHSVFPLFAKNAAVFIFHSVFNGEIRQNLPGYPKSTQKWEKSVQLFYPHTHTHPPCPICPICQPPLALSDLSLLRYLCMLARPQWDDSWKVDESKYWNRLSSTKSLISRDWYKPCSESGWTRFPITTTKQHCLQASMAFVYSVICKYHSMLRN